MQIRCERQHLPSRLLIPFGLQSEKDLLLGLRGRRSRRLVVGRGHLEEEGQVEVLRGTREGEGGEVSV